MAALAEKRPERYVAVKTCFGGLDRARIVTAALARQQKKVMLKIERENGVLSGW